MQRNEPLIEQQLQSSADVFEATVSALFAAAPLVAGPLIRNYRRSHAAIPKFAGSTAMLEGLNMVLAKLRQVLQDYKFNAWRRRGSRSMGS